MIATLFETDTLDSINLPSNNYYNSAHLLSTKFKITDSLSLVTVTF